MLLLGCYYQLLGKDVCAWSKLLTIMANFSLVSGPLHAPDRRRILHSRVGVGMALVYYDEDAAGLWC